jgi:hypothetical protein
MADTTRLPVCTTCGWGHAEGVAHVCRKCERITPKCKCDQPTLLGCADDDEQCVQCWAARQGKQVEVPSPCHCGWMHWFGECVYISSDGFMMLDGSPRSRAH